MGLCFSSPSNNKVTGSNSNSNNNRNPPKSQQIEQNQQEQPQKPREIRRNPSQRRQQQEQHQRRRLGGAVPCGKKTDFGYDKDFDGKYSIGKLLGHGQFGYTFVATDKGTGDRVAVKRIDKSKVKDSIF